MHYPSSSISGPLHIHFVYKPYEGLKSLECFHNNRIKIFIDEVLGLSPNHLIDITDALFDLFINILRQKSLIYNHTEQNPDFISNFNYFDFKSAIYGNVILKIVFEDKTYCIFLDFIELLDPKGIIKCCRVLFVTR